MDKGEDKDTNVRSALRVNQTSLEIQPANVSPQNNKLGGCAHCGIGFPSTHFHTKGVFIAPACKAHNCRIVDGVFAERDPISSR